MMKSIKNKLNNRKIGILDSKSFVQHAVLLPLIMRQNESSLLSEPYLLFEVRSCHLKNQPGEICFPGGRIEKADTCPLDAALRETAEELGISEKSIEILGTLDVLYTPHQLQVHPFVGIINSDIALSPNKSEVEKVFFVPLSFFLNNRPFSADVTVKMEPKDNFPYHLIPQGKDYKWRQGKYPVYFYQYNEYIIWGITARILKHFINLISPNL